MSKLLAAIAAALCSVFVLSACGGETHPTKDEVVKIDNTTTAKTTFDRWLTIAGKASAQQGGAAAVVPDPPTYTKCIAKLKASAGKTVKGQAKPTDAQYKQQCQTTYNSLRDQVMTFLIRSQWLESEASLQKIKVTDAEVKKSLDTARRQAFPKTADYVKFLKSSGQTEADLLFRQRAQLLQQKLTDKINKGTKKVTPADIQAYYDKNKTKQFTTPETRNLSVVLTKDEATAKKAKDEIDGGAKWGDVAKKYSTDPTSKNNGGTLPNVQKGQGEKAFDDAVFAAPLKKIVGPFKTSDGWYVVRVDKATPSKTSPLDAALKQTISQIISSDRQRTALDKYGKDYQKRWKKLTECQKDFLVADCDNYKAPKGATTAPATTAAPTSTAPATTSGQ